MDTMDPDIEVTDDTGDVVTFHYAPDENDQPMFAILEAVSWVKGVDVLELEPLFNVIDPDILNGQYGGGRRGDFYRGTGDREAGNSNVTFHYEDCRVSVSPGRISVRQT